MRVDAAVYISMGLRRPSSIYSVQVLIRALLPVGFLGAREANKKYIHALVLRRTIIMRHPERSQLIRGYVRFRYLVWILIVLVRIRHLLDQDVDPTIRAHLLT